VSECVCVRERERDGRPGEERLLERREREDVRTYVVAQ